MITKFYKGLSKMGKVRFVVFSGLAMIIVSLSLLCVHQMQEISNLKADAVAKSSNESVNIPADGKSHTIKSNLFTIEVTRYDERNFDATITPKIGRVLGQQGCGARGLNVMSVSDSDSGYTTIVD